LNYISENIINYITSIYGSALTKSYQELVNKEPIQYIRVNLSKISPQELSFTLDKNFGIKCEQIPNYSNILRITDHKNLLGKTLEHILGYYYIQSFSSFIPPLVLNPSETDIVLDLCAAPGSKTTELGEVMNNRGTIVANEIQLDRLKSLVHNTDRMNQMNVGVTHFKGEQLNTIYFDYFDKILVDAPCSGLGIVQKKIEVNDWWTIERVKRLSELQLKLFVSAIKMLKVGGEIVYSTCTLTVEENEMIIDKILKKYPVEVLEFDINIPSKNGITFYEGQSLDPSLAKAKRILPWEVESDGFFIIKLRKTGETEFPYKKEMRLRDVKLLDAADKKIRNLLMNIQNEFGIKDQTLDLYKYIIKNHDIYFVDKNWTDPNPGLFERIGTRFGTINKDNKIILNTQAAQALSNHISQKIYELSNVVELKIYLDGGIVKTSAATKGQYVVRYGGYTLGTGVFTEVGLKSQFPRSRRTQEIRSEFS
jgi:16S rRNA (cytosine1407-C5)-methyltransferase